MQVRQWIRDVETILGLCVRLLLTRKWIWVFLICMGILYGLLLSGLTEAAGEESRISLAVLWEREDAQAEELVKFLQGQPVLEVLEGEEPDARQALRENDILAILVIEEGYEEWLLSGRGKPMTLIYREGEESAKILSDLVAGGMLEKYCLYQSYALYEKQEGLIPVSWEEYQRTAMAYQETAEAGELIEIRLEEPGAEAVHMEAEDGGRAGTEAVYLQVVLGMLAGILMLLVLLLYAGGGESSAPERRGTGSISRGAAIAGNGLYGFLAVMLSGSVLLAVFLRKSIRLYGDGVDFNHAFLRGVGILVVFGSVVTVLFLVLREWIGNRERFLAIGMVVYSLLTVMALARVAAAFLPEGLELVLRYSPGGWFVDQILLLLYG